MRFRVVGEQREYEVEVVKSARGAISSVRIDGEEFDVDGGGFLKVHGRFVEYDIVGGSDKRRNVISAAVGPAYFEFEILPEGGARRRSGGLLSPEVVAPMPGKVLKVVVAEGDEVASGAPLIVLEAMKMETTLYAESAAVIGRIHVAAGTMVDHGAVLIELNPPPAQGSSAPESAPPAS